MITDRPMSEPPDRDHEEQVRLGAKCTQRLRFIDVTRAVFEETPEDVPLADIHLIFDDCGMSVVWPGDKR